MADAFGRLAAEDPSDAAAWYNRALCLAWLGSNREAVACLERAVDLEAAPAPDRAVEAWTLAELLRQGGGAQDLADDLRFTCTIDWDPGDTDTLLAEFPEIQRLPTPQAPGVEPGPELQVEVFEWPDQPITGAAEAGADRAATAADLPVVLATVFVEPVIAEAAALQPARRYAPSRPRSGCSRGSGRTATGGHRSGPCARHRRCPAVPRRRRLDGPDPGRAGAVPGRRPAAGMGRALLRGPVDSPAPPGAGRPLAAGRRGGVASGRRGGPGEARGGGRLPRATRRAGPAHCGSTTAIRSTGSADGWGSRRPSPTRSTPRTSPAPPPGSWPRSIRRRSTTTGWSMRSPRPPGCSTTPSTAPLATELLRRPVPIAGSHLVGAVSPLVRRAMAAGDPDAALDWIDRARPLADAPDRGDPRPLARRDPRAPTGPTRRSRAYRALIRSDAKGAAMALDAAETLIDNRHLDQARPLLDAARDLARSNGLPWTARRAQELIDGLG